MTKLIDVLNKLQELVDTESDDLDTGTGICSNIYNIALDNFNATHEEAEKLEDEFNVLARGWEHRCGLGYIVPASRDNDNLSDARNAYMDCQYTDWMWYKGEHAELRRELLAWSIEQCKNIK